MPVRPLRHSDWQILRAAKRSKAASTGRSLRITPTPRTKDGTFLIELVDKGLLAFATGSSAAPFEATYELTEKGQYAAEYGEYEFELRRPVVAAVAAAVPRAAPKAAAPKGVVTKAKKVGARKK